MADEENEVQNDDEGAEEAPQNGGGITSRLLSREILIPVAASAASAGIAYAAHKAPDLLQKLEGKGEDAAEGAAAKLGEKGKEGVQNALQGASESGGVGGFAAGALQKAMGGGSEGGKGKTRRLPIQRWTDVAVPVEQAYEAWTRFEEFPRFMHRVVSVEQKDEKELTWQEKIWFSKRQWKAEIVDQTENERIAWKTVSGTGHSGAVTFHSLDDNLTRVMVTIDFQPSGMVEKMASGLRFVKRAVQADLARFKAFVELQDVQEQGEDEEDEDARDRPTSRGGDDESGRGESDGGGESEEDAQQREEERREREARREERRQKVGA
jgi:uncharacterized membrane protein